MEHLANSYWGKRSGSWDNRTPRGHGGPSGFVFKIRRGNISGAGNDGPAGHKRRWYVARAFSKALRKGWVKKIKASGMRSIYG